MDTPRLPARALDVLMFWFRPPPHAERTEWFRKDAAFDDAIRARFAVDVEEALRAGYADWCGTPRGALARVLLLDQFTRNLFRDSARAFSGDAIALATACEAIARGFDRELDRYERWFLYLPFEHAEDAAMQAISVDLFEKLAADTGEKAPLEWAIKHAEVVRRFGRYPHRNALLGRSSTPEEVEFLKQPGSRF